MNETVHHENMNHGTSSRALLAMSTALFACFVVVMVLGAGKLTGTLDPLLARRGVGVMLGVVLMVTGNFVPKLRLFESAAGAAQSEAIGRFAGWTFVLCGLAFAAVFWTAPADRVFVVPPFIVVAGFVAVLARWLWTNGKRPAGLSPPWTPGRRMLAVMLATILWTCASFFADAAWGDNVARWMAIVFPFLLIGLAASRRRAKAESFSRD